jgi:hypothetical protein
VDELFETQETKQSDRTGGRGLNGHITAQLDSIPADSSIIRLDQNDKVVRNAI